MIYQVDGSINSQTCALQSKRLYCGNYSVPLHLTVNTGQSVDSEGPRISLFQLDTKKNILSMNISDKSEIELIQIFGMTQEGSEQQRIGVVFPDQMNNGEVHFRFPIEQDPATFIHSVYMTDKSGNTSALIRNTAADLFYSFKQINKKPVKTNFSIVGW